MAMAWSSVNPYFIAIAIPFNLQYGLTRAKKRHLSDYKKAFKYGSLGFKNRQNL